MQEIYCPPEAGAAGEPGASRGALCAD